MNYQVTNYNKRMLSTWAFPTKIIFGAGSIAQAADITRDLGIKRPLIVTDPGIVKCGLVERLAGPLKKAGLEWSVFEAVEGTPTGQSVLPADQVYPRKTQAVVIA